MDSADFEVIAQRIYEAGWGAAGDELQEVLTELDKRIDELSWLDELPDDMECEDRVKLKDARYTRDQLENLQDEQHPFVQPGWLFKPVATPFVTPAVTGRLCACGCDKPVTSARPEAKYATGACRVRAHRGRD